MLEKLSKFKIPLIICSVLLILVLAGGVVYASTRSTSGGSEPRRCYNGSSGCSVYECNSTCDGKETQDCDRECDGACEQQGSRTSTGECQGGCSGTAPGDQTLVPLEQQNRGGRCIR